MDNYETLDNGIIKQKKINKISYDYNYSSDYNKYGEKSNYLAYLRLGIVIGSFNNIPKSILDIGYGNGDFLKACTNIIPKCYGYDISTYPVPDKVIRIDNIFDKHYDIVTFFDSLEHFEDINFINKLNCDYILITLPWCHNYSNEWFKNWYHRKENEHLYHFNKEALINFFNEQGYDNISITNFEDTIRKRDNDKNILCGVFKKRNLNHNIIVTGGTGFIGSNIVKYLYDNTTANITVFDRTLKTNNMINSDRITYIKNVLEDNEMYEKLEKLNFNTFFHCGAITDTTYNDEKHITEVNVNSFKKIIDICKKKNSSLIYSSSASIYGNTKNICDITDKPNPESLYAMSKLQMEQLAINEYTNMKIIGLRYFNVYGNGETNKNKMSSMIYKLLSGYNKLFKYGEQKRDFVYIKDVVQANINAALYLQNGIYNVGNGKPESFNEIVENIKKIKKIDINIEYIDNPYNFYQEYTHANIEKTINKIHYKPKYNLYDGINDMLLYNSEI